MTTTIEHLRGAFRSLCRSPRLSLAALISLALGIGATVFMTVVVEAVLLRSSPFPSAERFVRVRLLTESGRGQGDLSYPELRELEERTTSFDAVEMAARVRLAVALREVTQRIRAEAVSSGYFELLGLQPALGRLFTRDEMAGEGQAVAVLGDSIWRREFGADPRVVGRALRVRTGAGLPERVVTVVGVLPQGFVGTVDYDISEIWLPFAQASDGSKEERESRNIWPLARRKPGVSLAKARAELEVLGKRMTREWPQMYEGLILRAEPFGESWRSPLRVALWSLLAAGCLLLLVACTNVGGLLLARLLDREPELALRAVLGAPPRWILARLTAETLWLVAGGGVAGGALAVGALRLLALQSPLHLPPYVRISAGGGALAAAAGLVLAASWLAGGLPAWLTFRSAVGERWRQTSQRASAGRRDRGRGTSLVTLQVAFTFVLLCGAALLLRSSDKLAHPRLGFRSENVLRLAISLDSTTFRDPGSWAEFASRARETLARVPGVLGVSATAGVLPPWDDEAYDLRLEGKEGELQRIVLHSIDPAFLRVLDLHLLAGRNLSDADRASGPRVALVSRSMATSLAGGDARAALGRRFSIVPGRPQPVASPAIEIVGVVDDVLYHGPRPIANAAANASEFYVPLAQFPARIVSIAAWTAGDPLAASVRLQRELSQLAPSSPVHWVSTMREELALQTADTTFYAKLLAGYAACALMLAALGIYAALAHAVRRRRREWGIRLATGARRGHILRQILSESSRLLAIGVLLGGMVSVVANRLLASLLYGVDSHDAISYLAVTAAIFTLGLAASILPARRAMAVDPAAMLQDDGRAR